MSSTRPVDTARERFGDDAARQLVPDNPVPLPAGPLACLGCGVSVRVTPQVGRVEVDAVGRGRGADATARLDALGAAGPFGAVVEGLGRGLLAAHGR